MLHLLIILNHLSIITQPRALDLVPAVYYVALPMLPIVISEELVHRFNFYLNASVRQGMRHQDELYKLVHDFSLNARLSAYQKACDLMEQGIPAVVTASASGYAVWVSLRSLAQFSEKPAAQSRTVASRLEACSV